MKREEMRARRRMVSVAAALLQAWVAAAPAAGDADARFGGAVKADPIRITNVKCAPAGVDGEACVTFDLAWDWAWRATWDVDGAQHGGKDKLSLENWDAAWVFVKFRGAGADGWRHATLSPNVPDHSVPEGAALEVGLSDDPAVGGPGPATGLGVFIHRKAPGGSSVDWKGVTLRWLQRADQVEGAAKVVPVSERMRQAPSAGGKQAAMGTIDGMSTPTDDSLLRDIAEIDAKRKLAEAVKAGVVEIQVFAIRMVYVPEGAFWVGDGTTNAIAGQFSAGDSTEPFRIESEAALTLGGTDRGNLGNRDNLFATDDFSASRTRWLPASFPMGFAAFYCMRHEITRGEMTAFLNTLSSVQQAAMKDFIGEKEKEGANGIRLVGSGRMAKYEADMPHMACAGMAWRDALAYAAWAGLRPMTELEFEKACRGPLKPVPGEFAWGTAAANTGADSERARARASYWGVLDLTGSLVENTVAVGRPIGRQFGGTHGGGRVGDLSGWNDFFGCFENENRPDILAGLPGWWMLGGGMIGRGAPNDEQVMRVSDRSSRTHIALSVTRPALCGFRAVRSVGAGRSQAARQADNSMDLFNEQLRIANVALQPLLRQGSGGQAGDGKTATITFDIAWDESWRNATNHDAAWVFFKARSAGATNWTHVKLAASQVLNPAGYGQESGTPLEFVVPDGPDGFAGVLLQRATPGAGPVSARGVTVLVDPATISHRPSTIDHLSIRAFGIEMVYVPEGPFYLGSGGAEANRFYRYTDGSQDRAPYRVADAGPIPTGPQEGRLWATGFQPDGSDAGEIPAAFPNGFRAFYCMKYQLKQGQFAGFLGMQSEIRSYDHAGRSGNCLPLAKVGTAFLAGVRWAQGAAFGAWAGLRPMTELEFEKACRGPLDPVPDELGPGYWGIRDLTSGGLVQRMVSAGSPSGRRFAGTHGGGATALPADWPEGPNPAVAQRGGSWTVESIAAMKFSARHSFGGDGKLDGWRGVRTAPDLEPDAATAATKPHGGFRLELDPLPELGNSDIAVFYLSGCVSNAGERAVQVELVSSLPDICFPDGAAARAFTAAPKSATPFKILTIATRKTISAVRRGQMLPVRIRNAAGEVLAEGAVRLPLADPMSIAPAVVGCLDGGQMALRMTNATDRPVAVKVEAHAPEGIVLAEPARNVELAVGTEAVQTSFPVLRRDTSVIEGFYPVPYNVVLSGGPTLAGEAVIELRAQSRWWVGRREIRTGPAMEPRGKDEPSGEIDDLLAEAGLEKPKATPEEEAWQVDPAKVFVSGGPPTGWQVVMHGAGLWPRRLDPPPKAGTILSAATRVVAPADRDAVLKFGLETDGWTWLDDALLATIDGGRSPGFYPAPVRVWINGDLVRDSRSGAKSPSPKSIALKKGANTLLIQFETGPDAKGQAPHVFPLFFDAKDHSPITDLSFDMEVKP